MRSLKKLVSILLIACTIVIMLPASLEAAEPQLRFSDPSTTQGATFNVDATFYADDIGSVRATLTYDTSSLKFISGDNATDNGGQIQLTGSGNGSTQLTWTLQFQALQVTTTQIEIASISAASSLYLSFCRRCFITFLIRFTCTFMFVTSRERNVRFRMYVAAGNFSIAFSIVAFISFPLLFCGVWKLMRKYPYPPSSVIDTVRTVCTLNGTGTPWIGVCGNYREINVAAQTGDTDSIWNFYRRLIRLRKEKKVISEGTITFLERENEDVLAYRRNLGDEEMIVFNNLTAHPAEVTLEDTWKNYHIILTNDEGKERTEETLKKLSGSRLTLQPYETLALER